MKVLPLILILVALNASGCSDKAASENKAREEADAKARAEAAKKEMKDLPEAFKPRYNKKLDQPNSRSPATTPPAEKKSP